MKYSFKITHLDWMILLNNGKIDYNGVLYFSMTHYPRDTKI